MSPRLQQFLTLIQISHFSPFRLLPSSLDLALNLDVTPADGPFRSKVKFMPANTPPVTISFLAVIGLIGSLLLTALCRLIVVCLASAMFY
jgi:hypothetical protein